MSSTVGVRELRQNLSRYLARVKEGESLTVTERGKEVARLVPSRVNAGPYARLVEEFGATMPEGDLVETARNLPPIRRHPAGTTDAYLEETRRR